MKNVIVPIILSTCLFGCRAEKIQDWRLSCLESRTSANTSDISNCVNVLNQTVATGSLALVQTVPILPSEPKQSTTAGELIESVKQPVQALPIPAPIKLGILGILAVLSGIFKRKDEDGA